MRWSRTQCRRIASSDPERRHTFDPARLQPEASLNRTSVNGVPGRDLLAADAVAGMRGRGGLDEVGRRIAMLLAALTTADPSSGLGLDPSPWRVAYLRHWHTVSRVWIGGGTAARLGPALAERTAAHLPRLGGRELDVGALEHPAQAALIGAARAAPSADRVAVFDFGHSYVKRGLARYDDEGRLREVEVRSPMLIGADALTEPALVEAVKRIVAGATDVDRVMVSLASYVDGGEPCDSRSSYAGLRAHHFGRAAMLIHDGTAAGGSVASDEPTAVIMLGTSIGVGFAPAADSVRPLAPDFRLRRRPRDG